MHCRTIYRLSDADLSRVKLKHSAEKTFGKESDTVKHYIQSAQRFITHVMQIFFITAKHNVQNAQRFIPAVTQTIPTQERKSKEEVGAAH